MAPLTPHLALFDFDGTLISRDSMAIFARRVCDENSLRFARFLLPYIPAYFDAKICHHDAGKIKEQMLVKLFGMLPADSDFRDFCSNLIPEFNRCIIPSVMTCLENHQKKGHTVAIVSASPSIWVKPWAETHGIENVMATGLAFDSRGRVTGFQGGNCNGEEKVARIHEFLNHQYLPDLSTSPSSLPYITAYGNSSSDIPMLHFANEGFMVKRHFFSKSYEIKRFK